MNQEAQQTDFDSIFTDSEFLKIQIKPSDIPGSGLGLFATESIQPNEFIAQYYGAVIPESLSFSEPFLMEDKMIYLDEKYCIISRSPASRANDIVKWEPQKFITEEYAKLRKKQQIRTIQGKKRNARIAIVGKNKAFLMATKAIEKGEEIYISYGYVYWEFFFKKALEK